MLSSRKYQRTSVFSTKKARQRKRNLDFVYGMSAIGMAFATAFNFVVGQVMPVSGLVMTELDTPPLNFTETAPVRRWHSNQMQVAYLSFNDVPVQNLGPILDILVAHQVPATFFVQGSLIQNEPLMAGYLRRAMEAGHYIGLHSMTHNTYLLYVQEGAAQAFMAEMEEAQAILYETTGYVSNLVRAPFGSANNFSQDHIDAVLASDFRIWDWHVDSQDWVAGQTPSGMVDTLRFGMDIWGWPTDVVVLFHGRAVTVDALPDAIRFFEAEGFRFMAYDPNRHFTMNMLQIPGL
ncbi:MAG: polysaccharide deacetylase family protein [Turicibacter sp.]|nr:polysaccharide deacetylase family protein [Turicibacter sp.]